MNDRFIMYATPEAAQRLPERLRLVQCAPGRLHALRLPDGRKAILIRRGESFWAYLALCPHMGGDLALGEYCARDNRISCCWHGYRFDADTGQFCENPNIETMKLLRIASPHFAPERQPHYRLQPLRVRIENGWVSIEP